MSRAGGFYTQCLKSPFDSIEDSAGRLGPPEGFGSVHVVGLNESSDLFSQFGHAGEDGAPKGAPLQLAEPGLDRIEPGRAGRREVQVKAGMGGQEVANRFGRVRAAVVGDQVQRQVGRVARWICARNWRNSVARWRRVVRPSTSPVATLKAACRFVVPCRW